MSDISYPGYDAEQRRIYDNAKRKATLKQVSRRAAQERKDVWSVRMMSKECMKGAWKESALIFYSSLVFIIMALATTNSFDYDDLSSLNSLKSKFVIASALLFVALARFLISMHEIRECIVWKTQGMLRENNYNIANLSYGKDSGYTSRSAMRHESGRNRDIFDNLIKTINTDGEMVQDEKMAQDVIAGHLRTHPKDIDIVLKTFDTSTIPVELIRKCYKGR